MPTFCYANSQYRYHRDCWIGVTKNGNLTVGHLIGATEFPISVSPRFKSCHLLVTSVPPRLTHRCHRVGHFVCNGWIFGDAYIYPFTTTYSEEKHSELCHTCPIQFSEREPPSLVLRSRSSTPTIWILISSLPKLLSIQSISSTHAKSVRE